MAGEGGKRVDFYGVMGLKKECSEAELRNAYKKLALRWHPDRCSASGNLKYVEEAKKEFQAIQEAYSVLSDSNKRFLYDVGVYDCDDDDDENGMGDFLNEMATMMRQNKSNNENRGEGSSSFEELKELFEDMFESTKMDMDGSFDYPSSSSSSKNKKTNTTSSDQSSSSSLPPLSFDPNFSGFCFGAEDRESVRGVKGGSSRKKRTGGGSSDGRKHKVSTAANDASDYYYYRYGSGGGAGSGGGGSGISAARVALYMYPS